MANLLKSGAQWLHQTLAASSSETVLYRRMGGFPSGKSMPATIGETGYPVEQTEGVFIQSQWRDFIILKEEFRHTDGRLYLPGVGDTISLTRNDDDRSGRPWEEWPPSLIYEVRSPGNEPCWRWSDRFETALRIHTQMAENTQSRDPESVL